MKIKRQLPESGEIYQMDYPFVRSTWTECDEGGAAEVPTWKPGTRNEPYGDDVKDLADGMGHQSIMVIGTYRPGKFSLARFLCTQVDGP